MEGERKTEIAGTHLAGMYRDVQENPQERNLSVNGRVHQLNHPRTIGVNGQGYDSWQA